MRKVLLIGGTGFVGRHLADALAADAGLTLWLTARETAMADERTIHFDLYSPASWQRVVAIAPDIIINAAGYGVVKEQTDLDAMYDVNYRLPAKLVAFLSAAGQKPFWLQIGTAFEYDLAETCLREDSACVPFTHYGMSKYLCSSFLLSKANPLPFLILRPFAMFGPYESDSKLVPYLLKAQKSAQPIPLSSGEQQRDYFYVKDLANFAKQLLVGELGKLNGNVFNVGSGCPTSLRSLAASLSEFIPAFNADLWQWGEIEQRANETPAFYNASTAATRQRLKLTPLPQAFQETVFYYYQQH